MALQMTYQPPVLDAPIATVWDLAEFNAVLQGGILQSGRMVFNCYASKADIGNPAKVLTQKTYELTAAQISAFQTANNLAPGQIASFAYGLAQSIQDVQTGTDGGGAPIMASFFANATTAQ